MNKEQERQDALTKIDELKKFIVDLDKPEGRWKPEKSDQYWFIHATGRKVSVTWVCWQGDEEDCFKFAERNVFKTKTEAQEILDAKLKLHEIIGDWEPNWGDEDQKKYSVSFNHRHGSLYKAYWNYLHEIGVIYFPTEEAAQRAIDEIGLTLMKL